MNTDNIYSMSNTAIAQNLGQRLEQRRLESNKSQKDIAQELGISDGTYRSAIQGKARLEVIIGIMRSLGQLDALETMLPNTPFSPIERLKMAGKKRQRASRKHAPLPTEDSPEW